MAWQLTAILWSSLMATGPSNHSTFPLVYRYRTATSRIPRLRTVAIPTRVVSILRRMDISSGKLTPTVVYNLEKEINSSNVLLSPDETLLYISNNQSGTITAAFFDASTGKLSKGCISGVLKGYVVDWSYTASMALEETTGTGRMLYVAEYGNPSSIGEISVTSAVRKCALEELPKSPVSDPNSPGLLSIGAFPPRPF